tara:strand:- start:53970 stop:54260 length:291 start_codon:yes stop_codon:yes gene_type:complete
VTTPTEILLPIKAVPGASRDQIAGMLGDRLKVRISAAPEAGKANKSICALIAKALSIKPAMVQVASGHTNPEKILRITGSDYQSAQHALDHLCQHS